MWAAICCDRSAWMERTGGGEERWVERGGREEREERERTVVNSFIHPPTHHLQWKDTFTVPLWTTNHIICHYRVIPLWAEITMSPNYSGWISIMFQLHPLKVCNVKLRAIICHQLQSGELMIWPHSSENHTWHSYSCRQCQTRQLGRTLDDTRHWLLLKMYHLSKNKLMFPPSNSPLFPYIS